MPIRTPPYFPWIYHYETAGPVTLWAPPTGTTNTIGIMAAPSQERATSIIRGGKDKVPPAQVINVVP